MNSTPVGDRDVLDGWIKKTNPFAFLFHSVKYASVYSLCLFSLTLMSGANGCGFYNGDA